ncbi:hypothetical protein AMQ84_31885, partial [Paenibacillus riograndensis]
NNLSLIIKWIKENDIYIHLSTHCAGYIISEQIIDFINGSQNIGEKLSKKKILWELICRDTKGFADILMKFNYPSIAKENSSLFWGTLENWIGFDSYTKHIFDKSNLQDLTRLISIEHMKKLQSDLNNARNRKRVFKSTYNPSGVIQNDLAGFYQMPLIRFLYSNHTFDNEDVISKIMKKYPLTFNGKVINNYTFIDSKLCEEIRISDWIVGILVRTFKFLRKTNENEMYSFIRRLNTLQRNNIKLLGDLIQDSFIKNSNYITIKDEFGLKGKLEWITDFREYEIRAYLK